MNETRRLAVASEWLEEGSRVARREMKRVRRWVEISGGFSDVRKVRRTRVLASALPALGPFSLSSKRFYFCSRQFLALQVLTSFASGPPS
jgi:hypothetical protein